MIEITLFLPDSVYHQAKHIAELKRLSVEEVLVESITLDSEMTLKNEKQTESLLKWAGKFSSPHDDLAEKHDHYIGVETLQSHE